MEVEELEVIVVDDHLAMRRGIELLLREAGFRIVGTAGTLDEARTMLSRRRFDVALLDVQLGQESSLGLVEDLLRGDPTAPIVLYTGYTSSDSVLHEAVRAGARGFDQRPRSSSSSVISRSGSGKRVCSSVAARRPSASSAA
jgi:DNA-binding NarL/FixJ family response regulator